MFAGTNVGWVSGKRAQKKGEKHTHLLSTASENETKKKKTEQYTGTYIAHDFSTILIELIRLLSQPCLFLLPSFLLLETSLCHILFSFFFFKVDLISFTSQNLLAQVSSGPL